LFEIAPWHVRGHQRLQMSLKWCAGSLVLGESFSRE